MHHWLALALSAASILASAASAADLLENGDFENGLASWRSQGPAAAHAAGKSPAPTGGGLLLFHAPPGANNSHIDQDLTLPTNRVYAATVRVRFEGQGLRPGLRIADASWQTLAADEVSGSGADWQTLKAVFEPPADGKIKFQLFGAGRENRGAFAGKTLFDDATLFALSPEEARSARRARVTVRLEPTGARLDPRFFGVNALFWIEDDAARADGKITAALKGLPCGFMRFPGGEVADNFHWKSNTLDNTKDFPFEEGRDELDFEEFIAWRTEIGAEAVCVVNLESGFLHGNLDAAVREAADWVRYANIERNCGIRYWEIGNETDLAGTRYPLCAAEYADAVVRFSKAMKAADPNILIGALGPMGPGHSAFLDNLTPEGLAQARAAGRSQLKAKDKPFPKRPAPGPAWWPAVCKAAAGHFDFAIIHRYDPTRAAFGENLAPAYHPGTTVRELDAFFRAQFGREIPIALTEWNTSKSSRLSPAEHGVSIAEMAMNYIASGVDMANYWPMRYPRGGQSGFREMLDAETNSPNPAYFALQLLATRAGAQVIAADCPSPAAAILACTDGAGTVTVFAASRSAKKSVPLSVVVPGAARAEATVLLPDREGRAARQATLAVEKDGDAWSAELPPLAFARITFATQLH